MHTTRLGRLSVPLLAAIAIALSACGTGRVASSAAPPSSTVAPVAADPVLEDGTERSVALVSTATGITAVDVGTTRVRWSAPGAVAALDGSAVFARGSGTLLRLDPMTGEEIETWPVDAALNPIVVAPGGEWVALTDHAEYATGEPPAATTRLLVVDGRTGEARARFELTGELEPEAFSPEGERLVVLDHRGATYRVDTLDLATGEQYPTIDENKDVVGDMAGQRVKGVLSADGRLLATLYRTSGAAGPGAFVHVLALDGWTYCVGLPSAFGQGPDGSVVIERHGDDAVVISDHANQRARFSFSDLVNFGSSGTAVAVTPGAGVREDAPYREIPDFRSLVAISRTASAPASRPSAGAPD
jgi:hypothetical protein